MCIFIIQTGFGTECQTYTELSHCNDRSAHEELWWVIDAFLTGQSLEIGSSKSSLLWGGIAQARVIDKRAAPACYISNTKA